MSDEGTCWSHVTQPLSTNGSAINNVIRELSREAAQKGIRSAVAASDARGNLFPDAEMLPVNFLKYLKREYLLTREQQEDALLGHLGLPRRNVNRLYRAISEALDATRGPILVHDGFLGAAGLVTIKRRHPSRPLFLYVHNALSRGYSRPELHRFLALTDAVVCVSESVRGAIARQIGAHATVGKLTVVLNGVDTTRFHPTESEPPDQPSILFLGMMTDFKAPHLLMNALKRLQARNIGFSATFVGSATHAEGLDLSPYEVTLRSDQRELGDHVTFRSFVPNTEVPAIYREHQILVVPSQYEEPCALVVFEGMSSGLAVVASRRGGNPEIGAGSIDYFDDDEQLSQILARLITDGALRARRGAEARQRALELTWASTFAQLQTIVGAP